jgi:MFS transporter, DHA2 family, methylenomycin A resistance protein
MSIETNDRTRNVDEAAREPVSRTSARWTLVATSLAFAVVQLDVSVVNLAIKPIGASLGGGVSALQWVVNAYTIALAALILTAGALGDRAGAKRVLIGGFGLFTVASAGCGLAPNLAVLVAARAIQGLGAAALVPCSLALLNHTFPDTVQRVRAIGLWAAGASVALSAGPLIGGALITVLGWRSIFFINVPIGVAGIGLTVRWAQETPRSAGRRVDLWGQAAVIVTLLALAAATIEGGVRGFGAAAVLTGYGLAAGAFVAFIVIESRHRDPMLPLRLFRSAMFSAAAVVGLLVNIAFYGLIFAFSLFFQREQHFSAMSTGLAFAPTTVAIVIANVAAARLARILGARWLIAVGAVLMAVGSAALLDIDAVTGYVRVFLPLAAIGFGLGLVVPAITSSLLGSVDPGESGIASGTLNTARQTGSVVGVALFGSLVATSPISGLRVALAICVALCTTAVLVAIVGHRS